MAYLLRQQRNHSVNTSHSGNFYRIKERIFSFSVHGILLVISLVFLFPLLLVVSGSFSDQNSILQYGYTLIPIKFSVLAYQDLIGDPSQLLNAYGVTILVTVIGTAISVLVVSLIAYAMARQDFAYRRVIAFFVFFTMLFSGGLVPSYIWMTQYLHLQDTLLVLILPGLVSAWNVLILRTYFSSLPQELIDAAKIDGASEWHILFQLVMPLSTPALATVALFSSLAYWNDWTLALLYINNPNLYPLQFLLYKLSSDVSFLQTHSQVQGVPVPTLSIQMAMAVLAIGPIAFVFLFFQKYFVRGITLGGLKGD